MKNGTNGKQQLPFVCCRRKTEVSFPWYATINGKQRLLFQMCPSMVNAHYNGVKRTVESLQSHFILTMSHWSSGLPVCFPSQGTQVQIPWGVLMWNRDSPVSVVSLHWWPRRDWSSLQPRLRRASSQKLSLGRRADNVIIPLDLTQLFCPGFTLAAGPPSSFTTDGVGCWGGALWRAGNLTSFSPCLTGLMDYLFASHHKGPVVGKLLLKSSWVTLLQLLVKVTRYF